MRKLIAPSVVALAALLPFAPVARGAALVVAVEQPAFGPFDTEQTVYVDAYVVDVDNTDERLYSFKLSLDGPNFSPGGVRFGPSTNSRFQEPANPPYVFAGVAGAEPRDLNSTYDRIETSATLPFGLPTVNVRERNGLVRIPLIIPANPAPGFYPLVVDTSPGATAFTGTGPISYATPPFGGFFVPEPAAAGLVALAAAPLLRRRR